MGFNKGLNFQYFQCLGSNDDMKKKQSEIVLKRKTLHNVNMIGQVRNEMLVLCWTSYCACCVNDEGENTGLVPVCSTVVCKVSALVKLFW